MNVEEELSPRRTSHGRASNMTGLHVLIAVALACGTQLAAACFTVSTEGGTTSPEPCVFPFKFKDKNFTSCTREFDSSNQLWCSVETDSRGNHVTGRKRWGHCNEDSCNPTTTSRPRARPRPRPRPTASQQTTSTSNINTRGETCNTVSGRVSNKPCVFPFKFRGTTHNECTLVLADDGKPWCSTSVNRDGVHTTGNWGHCECSRGSTSRPTARPAPRDCDYVPRKVQSFTSRGSYLPSHECATDGSLFIVGGKDATVNQYPFAALFAFEGEERVLYGCGGSLINRRYVLTAAHCVDRERPVEVILGELDITEECDCDQGRCAGPVQRFGIEDIVIHPGWGKDRTNADDIALIRLDGPATIRENVRPICLASRRSEDTVVNATVIGWGRTQYSKNTITDDFIIGSTILQTVIIGLNDDDTCIEDVRNIFRVPFKPDNQICGGEKGLDSCKGDSGGPLLHIIGRTYYQIGIVSYGSRFCGNNQPAVYTRVSGYYDWIKDNIRD